MLGVTLQYKLNQSVCQDIYSSKRKKLQPCDISGPLSNDISAKRLISYWIVKNDLRFSFTVKGIFTYGPELKCKP